MDTDTDRAPRKRWRVRTADGQAVEVAGARIVVSDGNALLVLSSDRGASPIRVFAPAAWLDVQEVAGRTRGEAAR